MHSNPLQNIILHAFRSGTNYPIFMAIADYIGYDATGREIEKDNLPKILNNYRKFEKGM